MLRSCLVQLAACNALGSALRNFACFSQFPERGDTGRPQHDGRGLRPRPHNAGSPVSSQRPHLGSPPGRRCCANAAAPPRRRAHSLGGSRGRTESKRAPHPTQERVRLVLVDNEDGDDVSIISEICVDEPPAVPEDDELSDDEVMPTPNRRGPPAPRGGSQCWRSCRVA